MSTFNILIILLALCLSLAILVYVMKSRKSKAKEVENSNTTSESEVVDVTTDEVSELSPVIQETEETSHSKQEVEEAETCATEIECEPNTPAPEKGLCVFLPNGSFIQEKKAYLTMLEALKLVDPEVLAEMQIPHDNYHLVSKIDHPYYRGAQHSLGKGYLLNTHSNTLTKKKQLEKISQALNLGWKVEILD